MIFCSILLQNITKNYGKTRRQRPSTETTILRKAIQRSEATDSRGGLHLRRQSRRATDELWQPEVPMLPRSRETSRAIPPTLLEGKGQERLTVSFLRRGCSLPRVDRQSTQAHCNHRQNVRYLSGSESLHVTRKGRREETARSHKKTSKSGKPRTKHTLNPGISCPSADNPGFPSFFFDSFSDICL